MICALTLTCCTSLAVSSQESLKRDSHSSQRFIYQSCSAGNAASFVLSGIKDTSISDPSSTPTNTRRVVCRMPSAATSLTITSRRFAANKLIGVQQQRFGFFKSAPSPEHSSTDIKIQKGISGGCKASFRAKTIGEVLFLIRVQVHLRQISDSESSYLFFHHQSSHLKVVDNSRDGCTPPTSAVFFPAIGNSSQLKTSPITPLSTLKSWCCL